jgi:RimJ/RimL family protein N-acetyltransferase
MLASNITKHSIKLKPSDASMLLDFLQAQPAETKRLFNPFPLDERALGPLLGDPHRNVYLILQNECPVAVWLITDTDSEMPELGVMVDSNHRRQGIGDLCIRMAKANVRLSNATGMKIAVHHDNAASIAMCSKAGFRFNGSSPDGQWCMEWLK